MVIWAWYVEGSFQSGESCEFVLYAAFSMEFTFKWPLREKMILCHRRPGWRWQVSSLGVPFGRAYTKKGDVDCAILANPLVLAVLHISLECRLFSVICLFFNCRFCGPWYDRLGFFILLISVFHTVAQCKGMLVDLNQSAWRPWPLVGV